MSEGTRDYFIRSLARMVLEQMRRKIPVALTAEPDLMREVREWRTAHDYWIK